jgi:hypothetical protein
VAFWHGWFIGDFPSIFKTKDFEVAVMRFKKGTKPDRHFHKIATEYNVIIYGKIKIKNNTFYKDDIFIFKPNEISDVEFLSDTCLVVIKIPSVKNDKYQI